MSKKNQVGGFQVWGGDNSNQSLARGLRCFAIWIDLNSIPRLILLSGGTRREKKGERKELNSTFGSSFQSWRVQTPLSFFFFFLSKFLLFFKDQNKSLKIEEGPLWIIFLKLWMGMIIMRKNLKKLKKEKKSQGVFSSRIAMFLKDRDRNPTRKGWEEKSLATFWLQFHRQWGQRAIYSSSRWWSIFLLPQRNRAAKNWRKWRKLSEISTLTHKFSGSGSDIKKKRKISFPNCGSWEQNRVKISSFTSLGNLGKTGEFCNFLSNCS